MPNKTLSNPELNDLYFQRIKEKPVIEIGRPTLLTVAGLTTDKYELVQERESYYQSIFWTPVQKSRLIESFLLNIPIAPVIISEQRYQTYVIIDGEQRVNAILDFFKNKLRLEGLEVWVELNGMLYSELPSVIKNAINNKRLSTQNLLFDKELNFNYSVIKKITYVRLNSCRLC